MNEPHSHDDFLTRLLAQDHAIDSPQLKEFRRSLQTLLEHAEITERRYRKVRGIAAVITVVICLAIVPLMYWQLLEPGWLLWLYFAAVFVSASIALGLTWRYNARFVPYVERTRDDLQIAIVKDLQQQVAELSRRLSPGR